MMEFDGEFTVDGSPEQLWKYFTDPDILQDCAPGCEEVTLLTPSRIASTLSVSVGSVSPSFDVEAVVVECDRPKRLELRACGEASRNSFEVTARQELDDNGDGTTTVRWAADAQVSGIIASMGDRALGSVADKLVNDFFENLENHVKSGTPAEAQFEAAGAEALDQAEGEPEVDAVADAGVSGGERGGPGESLVERGVGATVGAARGESEGSEARTVSFLSGVVIGVTGKLLWDRHRRTEAKEDGETGGSARSLLLALGTGIVGKYLWDRYRRPDAETIAVDVREAVDEQAGVDEGEAVDERTAADERTEGVGPDDTDENDGPDETSGPDETEEADTDDSDDPMDRLSSR
jgi:carbon monoxide dehydrogenase subunit G